MTYLYCVFFAAVYLNAARIYNHEKMGRLWATIAHSTICSCLCVYYLCMNDYNIITVLSNSSIAYYVYEMYWHFKKYRLDLICYNFAYILIFASLNSSLSVDSNGVFVIIGILATEIGNITFYSVKYKIYTNQHILVIDRLIEIYNFLIWCNIVCLILLVLVRRPEHRLCMLYLWIVSLCKGFGISKQLL